MAGWRDHVDQDAPQDGLRRSELVAVVVGSPANTVLQ